MGQAYILYGASGHGSVILDILEQEGKDILFFIDDNPNLIIFDQLRVRPSTEALADISIKSVSPNYIISIGSNIIRKKIAEETLAKYTFGKGVHPRAIISPKAKIGEGTVVVAGAVINAKSDIGKHVIINTHASVDHDCIIHDYVHIAPNATLCGNVTVGEGAHIGAGATIKQGIHIGAWAIVGAGAVVIRDVPDGATVIGNPAKQKTI
ncbi:acetyltransferase [Edaphocola flava]|uniref:acetyltransferase n=1 Tax=Edaphocola flava TaxID=2499629 RepID=UPI00100A6866|nr:acetyltransferase [Edaphocola flava]